MQQSEKNFLEKLADAVPGLKGYREKDARRDTDKRLREHLAAEIDRARRALEAGKRDLVAKGKLDLVDDAERVAGKLQRAADGLRFASYGYAGLFDQAKIQQAELDQMYAYDESLLERVRALAPAVGAVTGGGDAAGVLTALEGSADSLLEAVEGRKQIFNSPG